MENKTKSVTEFHSVDFMRQARQELTQLFLQDKEGYKEHLRKAMEAFRARQGKKE